MGRVDVCAFFTWPASSGGNPLFSYTETTESAQYSVGHLQKVITHAVDLKWWVRIPTFSGWMEFDLKRYFQQS
jgi:hypothetical protein